MSKQLLKRNEVDQNTTWDLTSYFEDEQSYLDALEEAKTAVAAFVEKYKGSLNTAAAINAALGEYRGIYEKLGKLSSFASLDSQTDQTNDKVVGRLGSLQIQFAGMQSQLSFLDSEIKLNDEEILQQAMLSDTENSHYIQDLVRDKPHTLSPEIEAVLSSFSQVLNAPYQIYLRSKLADISFPSFEVKGKAYPMSFVLFENEWEYEEDTDVRRASYEAFYGKLSEYQNTFAAVYQTKVLEEKAQATARGFTSVIDYLLFDQKVTREMYDRQIDVIMSELAPAMRRYASLLKDIHHLDKMTYSDLKIPVDGDFEPNISVEDSKNIILEGLEVLGEDYTEMVKRAFDERWIDFPQNLGKSTGAFCNSTYGVHPYILISWTKRMREVFVLAHELGHGGHFYLSHKNQNIFSSRPSLYFIEAPSTMNELIMANHLIGKSSDDRMKRWVYASMISRTYYHNFVTHLLEAAYQREVYRIVDQGKSLSAKVLNDITLKVFRDFWGDTVEIPEYAGLTWMRQPHYYMGLYPYTYSAGLTIATNANQKLLKDEITIEMWKDVLRAGGTKTPLELAAMVDVDLSTSQPLQETIAYISDMIDEIIQLTPKD